MSDVIKMAGVPTWGHILTYATISIGHQIKNDVKLVEVFLREKRLYQKTSYKHIRWQNGLWKNSPCFRVD